MSKWKARIGFFMTMIWSLHIDRVFAEDGTNRTDEPFSDVMKNSASTTDTNIWSAYIQMFVVLIIIIVMILLLVKFLSQKNKLWLGNRAINTLGGVSFGQNKSLQLVEIGNSVYLIGIGENVQLLEKISDPAEVADIMENLDRQEKSNVPLRSIKDWLFKRSEMNNRKLEEEADFGNIFQDKLHRISGQSRKVEEILNENKEKDDGWKP